MRPVLRIIAALASARPRAAVPWDLPVPRHVWLQETRQDRRRRIRHALVDRMLREGRITSEAAGALLADHQGMSGGTGQTAPNTVSSINCTASALASSERCTACGLPAQASMVTDNSLAMCARNDALKAAGSAAVSAAALNIAHKAVVKATMAGCASIGSSSILGPSLPAVPMGGA